MAENVVIHDVVYTFSDVDSAAVTDESIVENVGSCIISCETGGCFDRLSGVSELFAHAGKEVFKEWFRKLDDWTWKHFPDPKYGEWFAYLNRQGEPTHMLKGGKWKTFFHLPRCLYFSVRLMKEIAAK